MTEPDLSNDGEKSPAAAAAADPLRRRALFYLALDAIAVAIWLVAALAFHLSSTSVVGVAVAIVAAGVSAFFAVHREDLRKHQISARSLNGAIALALVIVILAVCISIIQPWGGSSIAATAPPTSTGVTTTPTTASTVTTSSITTATSATSTFHPLVEDGQCSTPNASDKKVPDYLLCVMNWCQGDVFFPDGALDSTRIQIKLHPRVINNTSDTLDISIWKPAALRLLVSSSDLPGSWRPPPATAKEADEPYTVQYDNQTYWAVAPNVPHDIDQMVGPVTGFASFWDLDAVPPNSMAPPLTYWENGRVVQQGDLVFQLAARTSTNNADILGLALIDRRDPTRVLALAKFDDWGPRLDSNYF